MALGVLWPSWMGSASPRFGELESGRLDYREGRYIEALQHFENAKEDTTISKEYLALIESFEALTYLRLGDFQRADASVTRSLNRLGDSAPPQIWGRVLNTRGQIQLQLGASDAALKSWQDAESAYLEARDEMGATLARLNQLIALESLGLYHRAEGLSERLAADLESAGDIELRVALQTRLGNLHRQLGNLDRAEELLESALQEARTGGLDSSAIALGLGHLAAARNQPQRAIERYRAASATTDPLEQIRSQLAQLPLLPEPEATQLARRIWEPLLELPPSRPVIFARVELGRFLASADILKAAVEAATQLQDDRALSYALGNLGTLTQHGESVREALYLARSIGATDLAYQWQWQLGRQWRSSGREGDAIAAYTQAVESLQLLRRDLAATDADLRFDFRDRVEPVYRELIDLLLTGPAPTQERLQRARDTIEALQLAQLDNFFRTACLDSGPVRSIPTATAAIHAIVLDDRLEVILSLPDGVASHHSTPIERARLESQIEQLRRYLLEPDRLRDLQGLARQFSMALIEPFTEELVDVERLVFVLDGALKNLPMSVLYDGERYSIEQYAIALSPGLSVKPPIVPSESGETLIAGVSRARQVDGRTFSALPHVESEWQALASIVKDSNLLANEEFTASQLSRQLEGIAPRVLHVATHGQFGSTIEDTFILMWDELLDLNEWERLLLASIQGLELLVLSACETATGDERAALGLAGVATRSGAKQTLATLWQVDDESTSVLMGRFYQELTHQPPAEALRRAQLDLLQERRWEHPFFWSAFVLVGNERPDPFSPIDPQ